jgi:hypothetical protein
VGGRHFRGLLLRRQHSLKHRFRVQLGQIAGWSMNGLRPPCRGKICAKVHRRVEASGTSHGSARDTPGPELVGDASTSALFTSWKPD